MAEKWVENNVEYMMVFLYDDAGSPIGFLYRTSAYAKGTYDAYFYEKNFFGDVIGIYDESGSCVAKYNYNAWGVCTVQTNVGGIATLNPIRYRGYYYDTHTGLYYLQSRYYNPDWGRFISMDDPGVLSMSPNALSDKNLYIYCDNNPIMRTDATGDVWESVFDIASLVVSIVDVCVNPSDPMAWVGLVGDTIDLIPFVTGVGELAKVARVGGKAIDAIDNATDAVRISDNVVDTAKALGKTDAFKGLTGSYEILYENGMTYVGKGGLSRAARSAAEHGGGVKVQSIVWEKASNHKEAFIQEYKKMCQYGVPGSKGSMSYNKIWSPGRKYYYEQYGSYYSFGGQTW